MNFFFQSSSFIRFCAIQFYMQQKWSQIHRVIHTCDHEIIDNNNENLFTNQKTPFIHTGYICIWNDSNHRTNINQRVIEQFKTHKRFLADFNNNNKEKKQKPNNKRTQLLLCTGNFPAKLLHEIEITEGHHQTVRRVCMKPIQHMRNEEEERTEPIWFGWVQYAA